jgi:hypothetical protein
MFGVDADKIVIEMKRVDGYSLQNLIASLIFITHRDGSESDAFNAGFVTAIEGCLSEGIKQAKRKSAFVILENPKLLAKRCYESLAKEISVEDTQSVKTIIYLLMPYKYCHYALINLAKFLNYNLRKTRELFHRREAHINFMHWLDFLSSIATFGIQSKDVHAAFYTYDYLITLSDCYKFLCARYCFEGIPDAIIRSLAMQIKPLISTMSELDSSVIVGLELKINKAESLALWQELHPYLGEERADLLKELIISKYLCQEVNYKEGDSIASALSSLETCLREKFEYSLDDPDVKNAVIKYMDTYLKIKEQNYLAISLRIQPIESLLRQGICSGAFDRPCSSSTLLQEGMLALSKSPPQKRAKRMPLAEVKTR